MCFLWLKELVPFVFTSSQNAVPAQRLCREHKAALFLTSAWYTLKCLMRQLFVTRECNIYVYVCFAACMPELHMCAGPAGARRANNPELELQMIVSWCVGAGNQTQSSVRADSVPAQGLIVQKTLVLGSFPVPDSPSFPSLAGQCVMERCGPGPLFLTLCC